MDQLLNKIFDIVELNNQEKEEFIESFYNLLFAKTLKILSSTDTELYNELETLLESPENNIEKGNEIIKKAYSKPELKEKMDAAINEVLDELVDTIAKSATEEQKQKILVILPA